jgi:hypothetical protein
VIVCGILENSMILVKKFDDRYRDDRYRDGAVRSFPIVGPPAPLPKSVAENLYLVVSLPVI